MGALTEHTPKPLLRVHGKTLLEHKLERLPKDITEIIFVVGYLGDAIRKEFGDSYRGIPVRYVEQKELLGTAHSLWQAKELLKHKFLVLMGDDLYSEDDLKRSLSHDWALLVRRTPNLIRGGKVMLDEKGHVKDIVEGDNHGGIEGIVYTGLCVLQPKIFEYPLVKLPNRDEYGLPQTILQALDEHDIAVVEATGWISVTDGDDLAQAEKLLQK